MSAKDKVLGRLMLQEEESFAGDGAGAILQVAGLREFEHSHEAKHRTTRVSVWRLDESQEQFGSSYTGRLDVEAGGTECLRLLARTALREESSAAAGGLVRRVYSMPRAALADLQSLRMLLAYDGGPWVVLGGAAVSGLRVTVRAQTLAHVSADWAAAARSQEDTDPAWASSLESFDRLAASSATVEVDGEEVGSGIEFSVLFSAEREAARYGRGGEASALPQSAPGQVKGTVVQYFEGGAGLPEAVRSGSEFSLSLVLKDAAGAPRVEVSLPRCVAEGGQPDPVGAEDVTQSVAFRCLQDREAAAGEFPTLAISTED